MRTIARYPSSLFSLVIDFFAAHSLKGMKFNQTKKVFECLPYTIRNKIIRKYTTTSTARKYSKLADLVSVLMNEYTFAIDLTILRVNENVFNALSKCKKLRCLYVCGDENACIPVENFEKIFEHLPLLEILVLKHVRQVTDFVIESITQNCPSLTALDLSGCSNITHKGFNSLVKLYSLTWMKFSFTKIGDESITKIVESKCGPNIKELRFDGCKHVTERGIMAIAENCSIIEVLIFDNCCRFSDGSINRFQGDDFPFLKELRWTITW